LGAKPKNRNPLADELFSCLVCVQVLCYEPIFDPMLTAIIPKLPMRDKNATKQFYMQGLGFHALGDYGDYLLLGKDQIEIHFFEFKTLNPLENDGQVYIRCTEIADFYQHLLEQKIPIHPQGPLERKPWGQQEFSLLDPDHNLLTFGQAIP
jgi:hypothetical protein